MRLQEFKTRFPHMFRLIELIGQDNDMPMAAEIGEGEIVLANYEAKAVQLTEEEKETLAAGDHDEAQAIVQRTGFTDLDEYLTEVFDGRYRRYYFSD